MADSNEFRSLLPEGLLMRADAQTSPRPVSVPPGLLGPSSSSPLRPMDNRWSTTDISTQQQQHHHHSLRQFGQSEPGWSHGPPQGSLQLRQEPYSMQQHQQDYRGFSRQMNRQEWPDAAPLHPKQRQEEHLRHLNPQATSVQQGSSVSDGEGPLDLNGSQQQHPLSAVDANRPPFQLHSPLQMYGHHSPGLMGSQPLPPPGFFSEHMGRSHDGVGSGGSGLGGYDRMMAPLQHSEPSMQDIQARAPIFNTGATSLGPPPGLGSRQFGSVDGTSGSVSQQLEAYQERLEAQLQIQHQLLQRQLHMQQLQLQHQQRHQGHLGSSHLSMDQRQLPRPHFMPQTSLNQSGLEAIHPHQEYTRHLPFVQSSSRPASLDSGLLPSIPHPGFNPNEQQDQVQQIQQHLSQLLFNSYNRAAVGNPSSGEGAQLSAEIQYGNTNGTLRKEHPSLEEIEAAQLKAVHALQQQKPRKSLSDLVLPPEVFSTSSPSVDTVDRVDGLTGQRVNGSADNDTVIATAADSTMQESSRGGEVASHRHSHIPNQYPRKASIPDDSSFSIKDTHLFAMPKYDPYRPSQGIFDSITMEMKELCQELLPNPAEETRKIALLDRLQELANEVFGKADVLPFGSSGNGLALANADMDLCVFLPEKERKKGGRRKDEKKKSSQGDGGEEDQHEQEHHDNGHSQSQDQGSHGNGETEENDGDNEEVSPADFVERMGNRLEEDPEFCDILQLRKARVPIVKLVHSPTGIACDIGYENHLALWNTRLLRAYSRIDGRLRELVSIIKYWAKRRKINNPYVGTLSSYAYVLLVIHVLQVRGILPNLQTITADNSGRVPIWDCQGFNRYFFESVSDLDKYWRPTEESRHATIGELLYEFFRYFVNEFRYANQVVSIRKGGLLTKDQKEWSKEFLQAENRPQTSVRSRYLFCIEDPFEVDHNVARTVDRYTLFTIRGEFMRATKVLSRGGDNIIARLCQEKEDPPSPERTSGASSLQTGHEVDGAGEGDGGERGGEGEQHRSMEDGATTKPPRSPAVFPEGDEPIRNNGSSYSSQASRNSHYGGGGKRVSLTPRDNVHHSHHGQGSTRLSHQGRQQHHHHQNSPSQSQRDPFKRASIAGSSYGTSPRDRQRQ